MIKVLVVDDQPAVRQGLRMRLGLEPDFAVVGEAGDGAAALQMARQLEPDVVLMDLQMPRMDGITATSVLRDEGVPSAVVIFSMYDDRGTRERAKTAGAVGFVGKNNPQDDLVATIREAASASPGP